MEQQEKTDRQSRGAEKVWGSSLNHLWVRLRYAVITYLEKKGAYRSAGKAKAYLICFCIASSSIMAWSISRGIGSDKVPKVNRNPNTPVTRAERNLPYNEGAGMDPIREKLQEARHYLDSLKADPAGKATYNAIIKSRPGLVDSLRKAEQYYFE